MASLPQHIVNGLVLGSIYSLLALGYSMVYGVLRILNFAHGDIFMVAAFAGWAVAAWIGNSVVAPHPLLAATLSLAVSVVAGTALGVIVERAAYRPLKGSDRLSPLLSAIGASLVLRNSMALITGGRAKTYPPLISAAFSRPIDLGPVTIPGSGALMFATSVVLSACMTYFVSHTGFGRMMRATAEDPGAAKMCGVSTGKVIAVTFALGSALAGAAGLLVTLHYTQVDFMMGFSAGMKAFTAAVLGGIGNLSGALMGGLALGVAESLGVGIVSPVYKDAVSFVVLILVLILRPGGILGKPPGEKV